MASFIRICQLKMHSMYRRQGIGTQLMQALFKDYVQHNFCLKYAAKESLHTFYALLGFCCFFKIRLSVSCNVFSNKISFGKEPIMK